MTIKCTEVPFSFELSVRANTTSFVHTLSDSYCCYGVAFSTCVFVAFFASQKLSGRILYRLNCMRVERVPLIWLLPCMVGVPFYMTLLWLVHLAPHSNKHQFIQHSTKRNNTFTFHTSKRKNDARIMTFVNFIKFCTTVNWSV